MSAASDGPLLVGTAGWTIPGHAAADFPDDGTHLERYAGRLHAAEINSSFHRPHRASTYGKWASSVPSGFRFSVKVPKEITHRARLADADSLLDGFLEPVRSLKGALGCLLVQLPPSLAFDAGVADRFFVTLRDRYSGGVACEPRHPTWLQADADALLISHHVARVAADPDRPVGAGEPGGWSGLTYFRLHGSPRMYYSSYADDFLDGVAARLTAARAGGTPVWCIFDNTVQGWATRNALDLVRRAAAGAR